MRVDRRHLLAVLAAGLGSPALAAPANKNGAAMSAVTAYDGLQGGSIRLVVNTASLCGYTPQYAGLEQLFERFHDRGFMIVGGRVEDERSHLGLLASRRFSSPLIEPDVPISGIRLSDWFHRKAHDAGASGKRSRRARPSSP
jgi:hypothetical protein